MSFELIPDDEMGGGVLFWVVGKNIALLLLPAFLFFGGEVPCLWMGNYVVAIQFGLLLNFD